MIIIKAVQPKTQSREDLEAVSQYAALGLRWNQPRHQIEELAGYAANGLAMVVGKPFAGLIPDNVDGCLIRLDAIRDAIADSWDRVPPKAIIINHETDEWRAAPGATFWLNRLIVMLADKYTCPIWYYNHGQRRSPGDDPFPFVPLDVYHSHLHCSLYYDSLIDAIQTVQATQQTNDVPINVSINPLRYWDDSKPRKLIVRVGSTSYMTLLGTYLRAMINVCNVVVSDFDSNDQAYMHQYDAFVESYQGGA